jgi:hypothetical protein
MKWLVRDEGGIPIGVWFSTAGNHRLDQHSVDLNTTEMQQAIELRVASAINEMQQATELGVAEALRIVTPSSTSCKHLLKDLFTGLQQYNFHVKI